jgi:hypothetical protein
MADRSSGRTSITIAGIVTGDAKPEDSAGVTR